MHVILVLNCLTLWSRCSTDKGMLQREARFDLNTCPHATLPTYNALYDPNMRHYFENKARQRHLYVTGQVGSLFSLKHLLMALQVDRHGRVIDNERNVAKLHIIEKEFEQAEKQERIKQRDEMEMRVRCDRRLPLPRYSFVIVTLLCHSIAFRKRDWKHWSEHVDKKYCIKCGKTGRLPKRSSPSSVRTHCRALLRVLRKHILLFEANRRR